jgi:FemAB-related protein (PEP-CTERM system-associated)
LLADSFGLQRVPLVVGSEREIRGVLPLLVQSNPVHGLFLTSLPFVNYGGLLAADDSSISNLVRVAGDAVRRLGARYAELRQLPGRVLDLPSSTHKVRPVLDLPREPATLWDHLPSKLRSQIRRPGKEGIEAHLGGLELLDEFYRVLAIRWKQLGSPIYNRAFFGRILATFPAEHAIVTVRKGATVVGAGWLHFHDGICEIPWAGTLLEWNRFSPNMLLYWRGIEAAISQGCREFDFGRSTAGAPTHQFKLQWGPRCEPLPWFYVLGDAQQTPAPAGDGRAATAFRRAWSRLPLSWTIRLGHALARRLPL